MSTIVKAPASDIQSQPQSKLKQPQSTIKAVEEPEVEAANDGNSCRRYIIILSIVSILIIATITTVIVAIVFTSGSKNYSCKPLDISPLELTMDEIADYTYAAHTYKNTTLAALAAFLAPDGSHTKAENMGPNYIYPLYLKSLDYFIDHGSQFGKHQLFFFTTCHPDSFDPVVNITMYADSVDPNTTIVSIKKITIDHPNIEGFIDCEIRDFNKSATLDLSRVNVLWNSPNLHCNKEELKTLPNGTVVTSDEFVTKIIFQKLDIEFNGWEENITNFEFSNSPRYLYEL